jgi:hypothetical protein
MKKKPRQTARKGVEVALCLEGAEGSGPWGLGTGETWGTLFTL